MSAGCRSAHQEVLGTTILFGNLAVAFTDVGLFGFFLSFDQLIYSIVSRFKYLNQQ